MMVTTHTLRVHRTAGGTVMRRNIYHRIDKAQQDGADDASNFAHEAHSTDQMLSADVGYSL